MAVIFRPGAHGSCGWSHPGPSHHLRGPPLIDVIGQSFLLPSSRAGKENRRKVRLVLKASLDVRIFEAEQHGHIPALQYDLLCDHFIFHDIWIFLPNIFLSTIFPQYPLHRPCILYSDEPLVLPSKEKRNKGRK